MTETADHSFDQSISALYRRANDRIHASEGLREETLQRMRQAGKQKKEKLIPFSSYLWRMGISVTAAAVIFFLAGRFLAPRTIGISGIKTEIPGVLASNSRFLAAPNMTDATGRLTIVALDMRMGEAIRVYELREPAKVGDTPVYLTAQTDEENKTLTWCAYYESDNTVWCATGAGMTQEQFLDTLRLLFAGG